MRKQTLAGLLPALFVVTALGSVASAQMLPELYTSYPEASSGGGTSSGFPVNTYWHDMRMESIITVAELTAAGLYPGAIINQVQFKVAEAPGQAIIDHRIRMGHTSSATHTGTYQPASNLTVVHGPVTYQIGDYPANQWKAFMLTTPFTWNGTQNLVIDFTHDCSSYVSGGGIFVRTAPTVRSLRGYSDSGFTYPFDTMTNAGTGTMVPSLKLGFPPPQLTVYLNNPPNPRENIPYSAQATALESPVYLPYTWSLNPLVNANWLSINPTTGQLSGTPPAFSAGNVTFEITVTNSRPAGAQSDTKPFSLTVIGIPNLIPQYTDNFNTPSLVEQYDVILNSKAALAYKTQAASGTGSGLRLSSNQSTGTFLPIDLNTASHRAVLDNPAQWEGGGVVDPSDFVGKAQLITRAPGVFTVNVSFQYRIVQTGTVPSTALAEYQNNMVFEWSNNAGATWNIAAGPNALPTGIYRTPTPGTAFITEAFTITGLSGAADQMIRFRFRWLCRLKDDTSSIQTYIDIDNLSLIVPFTITTLDVPSATANVPYTYENGAIQLVQVSGANPVSWGATGKPAWMTINASTGAISGMPGPGDAGTSNITFTATDAQSNVASRPVTLTVKPAPSPVAISNLTTLPEASEGVPYQYSLSAFGGAPVPAGAAQPRYFWAITTNAQSAWLSIDPMTGLLSGTPPAGSFGSTVSFTADVRDGLFLLPEGTAANASSKVFYISIVERLTIVTSTLDLAAQGSTYRPVLQAAGGVEPYTWQILSGNLPAGLTFEPTTGQIFGVPLTSQPPAAYDLMLEVRDAGIQSAIFSAQLIVQPAATTTNLQITTTVLDPGTATETQPYEAWLDASGGVPPYNWSIPATSADPLPPGVSLDNFGRISGTPFSGTARTYMVDVLVTDSSATPLAFTRTVNIEVQGLISPPTIVTSILQDAEVGIAYPAVIPSAAPNINAPALRVSGGVPPFTWTLVSGTLPVGLSFSPVGVIAGVPVAGTDTDGPYPITVRVSDGLGNQATRNLTLNVNAFSGTPLAFIATTFPAATVGSPYSFRVTASGGANPTGSTLPYVFRKINGQLPTGLDFDPFGQLRGTPIAGAGGEYALVFEVKDAANFTAQAEMVLSVIDNGSSGSLTQSGTTSQVSFAGSGSGCSLGQDRGGSVWWIVAIASIGGLAMVRRRRKA